MDNFVKIMSGVDVSSLLDEVHQHENLWDKNPCRLSKRGPHYESHDVVLRYKDETENQKSNDWSNFSDEHIPDWYEASDYFPTAKNIAFDLMSLVKGEILGGVFLYKLEPGKKIHLHKDFGWHPSFYDKFNICLQSNSKAAFCYEDGNHLFQEAGDIHFFRNDINHWVINEGDTDHIILCVCIRVDRGYRVPFSESGWTMDESIKKKEALCQWVG